MEAKMFYCFHIPVLIYLDLIAVCMSIKEMAFIQPIKAIKTFKKIC